MEDVIEAVALVGKRYNHDISLYNGYPQVHHPGRHAFATATEDGAQREHIGAIAAIPDVHISVHIHVNSDCLL